MNANIQSGGEKQNKRTEQNSSSQTICSCDNGAGRDGSQGCFVPFAGCLQLALHLPLQAGFSLGPSLPVSPWQCGTQKPPGWSLLRFFSAGGCEFSICIHAHAIVFYPVARSRHRFILCLHFAVLQLFLLPRFLPPHPTSGPMPSYQYPVALPVCMIFSSLLKYKVACVI